MKNNAAVLVLDYDISPGPGVLCALTQARCYRVVGVTTKHAHRSSCSLRHSTAYLPDFDYGDDVTAFIGAFQAKFAGSILLPTTSRSVRWLIRHRNQLSQHWKFPRLPHPDAFETAVNKARFAEFAREKQIPTPITQTLPQFLSEGGQGIDYPILAKPTNFNAGEGIKRFRTFDALQSWSQNVIAEDYIVQNWLDGIELSAGLYCEKGTIHTAVFYTGITRRSRYGAFHSLRFIRDEKALAVARQVVSTLNWNGVANIDLRYGSPANSTESLPYALEINPRPWGNFLGATFMGVNFAELMCQSALGEEPSSQNYRIGNYFSPHDSMVALRQKAKFRSLKGQKIEEFRWRDSALKMLWSDPLTPLGYFLRSQEGNAWHKISRFVQHSKPQIEASTPNLDNNFESI